jgi:hypothetical protein
MLVTEVSDVLAWLGLEATGFGLALGGFGLALAWLGLSHGLRGGSAINHTYCGESSLELPPMLGELHVVKATLKGRPWSTHSHSMSFHINILQWTSKLGQICPKVVNCNQIPEEFRF